jgi:hypothetical protein
MLLRSALYNPLNAPLEFDEIAHEELSLRLEPVTALSTGRHRPSAYFISSNVSHYFDPPPDQIYFEPSDERN